MGGGGGDVAAEHDFNASNAEKSQAEVIKLMPMALRGTFFYGSGLKYAAENIYK